MFLHGRNYKKSLINPPSIYIGNKKIGFDSPVFIIAEAGVNYNNDLKTAYKMIDEASKAGADAIKFQTFITDEIQLKKSIKPNYQKRIKHKNYYDIIKGLEPSFDDQIKISNYCKKRKIIFLSTPYDTKSTDFLNSLGVPAFKIASSDLTNHLLIEYILKKGKPIILSTGLSSLKEINQTVNLIKKSGMKNKLILVQTTSDYPTCNKDVNLNVIPEYYKKYKVITGFSDHTRDYIASIGAVALGAKLLEKHFTLDRNFSGPDQSSSLEPAELKDWIKKIRLMELSLGSKTKIVTRSEQRNLSMRKILVIKPAKKGSKITKNLLGAMRGTKNGITPLETNVNSIIGKKLLKDILNTTQFSWDLIN